MVSIDAKYAKQLMHDWKSSMWDYKSTTATSDYFDNKIQWYVNNKSTGTTSDTITIKDCIFTNTSLSIKDNSFWVTRYEDHKSDKKYVMGIAPDRTYMLPDGSRLVLDEKGNYRIEDDDAKVTYKANRVREFNRFLNASDILEDFIRHVGKMGVRQSDILNLPIELFINYLILRAAQADDVPPPPDVKLLPPPSDIPRCKACGRFIKHSYADNGVNFCDDQHMLIFVQKKGLT